MLANFGFLNVVIYLINISEVRGVFGKDDWLGDLAEYTKEYSKVFQTVILTDESTKKDNLIISEILRKVARQVPSKVINFEHISGASAQELVKSVCINRLRPTTLFITIQSVEADRFSSQASAFVRILSQIFGKNTRPKTLAVVLSREKQSSYGGFLQGMWTEDILDFTVLEVVKTQGRIYPSSNLWQNVSLHQFNPFTKVYTMKSLSRKTTIFPDKLRNLNGFEMKAGSINRFPTLFLKQNDSGFPTEVTGPEAEISKALSKAMNFKIIEVTTNKNGWGSFDIDSDKTTGLLKKVSSKDVQFARNLAIHFSGAESLFEYSTVISKFCYSPIVPVIKIDTFSVEFSHHYFYMGFLMLLLMSLPVIVSHFFKFDKQFWAPLYVFQAALGFTVPREPKRIEEQIFFITMLFVFFVSSTQIYGFLTGMELRRETEVEMNTLQALRNSKLTFMTDKTVADILRKSDNEEIAQSMVNEIIISNTQESCIQYLIINRNVTCIMKEERAHFFVDKVKNENPKIKVGKICLRSALQCMILRPGSPYLERIDHLLARLLQSGLIRKWNYFYFDKRSKQHATADPRPNHDQKPQILITFAVVILIGNVIAFVIFFYELDFFAKWNVRGLDSIFVLRNRGTSI